MKAAAIRLKVCGMRDIKNIQEVARLHPDYMGFIFFNKSKRYVGPEFTLPEDFPKEIRKVGVFVNEASSNMLRYVSKLSLDFVQLHGEEPPSTCNELLAAGAGVIKVFSIGDSFDLRMLNPYKKVVNYFMFDTKGPDYGGTGAVFDWRILEKYDQDMPFFLGGGLSAGNIHLVSALKGMNLHALDVNSGVELSPGLKSLPLVEEMMKTIEHSFN